MILKMAKFALGLGILMLALTLSNSVRAQEASSTLSGAVSAPTGAVVPNAKVSVRNVASGQLTETQADSSGHYTLPKLPPGEYEVSVSAFGFGTNTVKVTVVAGVDMTTDLTLGAALSLGDLGFSPTETQGSAQDQARLDKRSHMLKIHQRLGLIATVPLVASLATSFGAGGRQTSTTDRYVHLALGSATGDLYFMSAYYAFRAPKIPGTPTHGGIRAHKILAWIHVPGMVLTPILGAIAFDEKSKGERVHGIARAHGPVAFVTAGAYIASIISVSFKF